MRLELVRHVFAKEFRETMRDRRSLAIMFGIPLLLYPLLILTTATLGARMNRRNQEQPARIVLVNGGDAPRLLRELQRRPREIRLVHPADPDAALQDQKIDAILVVPRAAETRALASEQVAIPVKVDRSRGSAEFTIRKIDGAVAAYERWVLERRLEAAGVDRSILRPVSTEKQDVASADRRMGRFLGALLPTMLLVTGMLGAFFPAISSTTLEKEFGTLEALLVSPASRLELLAGKTAMVLLSGLITALLNLISMSLVMWRIFSMGSRPAGAVLNPATIGLAYLAAVPTLIFFAAVVMAVGLFARNYREANSYATPVMLLSLVPTYINLLEPRPTPGLLVMPLVNTCVMLQEILSGRVVAAHFLIAFLSSALYAGLTLSLSARLFQTEDLVNPAWEPLSLKGLRRPRAPGARRLPAVDEALCLFAVSLLLTFYVGPSLAKIGLLPALIVTELGLIAAPVLLFALAGRYDFRRAFLWRPPGTAPLIGGLLLGVGLIPWAHLLAGLIESVWPRDPATSKAMEDLFRPDLQARPLLTALAVGFLAGTCEEILYRGPLLTALARKASPVLAVGLSAALFAAAHLDAHGMLPRAAIGVALGCVALRSRSIFPAMLLHFAFDAVTLLLAAWAPQGTPLSLEALSHGDAAGALPFLAGGLALCAVGWAAGRPGPFRGGLTQGPALPPAP